MHHTYKTGTCHTWTKPLFKRTNTSIQWVQIHVHCTTCLRSENAFVRLCGYTRVSAPSLYNRLCDRYQNSLYKVVMAL